MSVLRHPKFQRLNSKNKLGRTLLMTVCRNTKDPREMEDGSRQDKMNGWLMPFDFILSIFYDEKLDVEVNLGSKDVDGLSAFENFSDNFDDQHARGCRSELSDIFRMMYWTTFPARPPPLGGSFDPEFRKNFSGLRYDGVSSVVRFEKTKNAKRRKVDSISKSSSATVGKEETSKQLQLAETLRDRAFSYRENSLLLAIAAAAEIDHNFVEEEHVDVHRKAMAQIWADTVLRLQSGGLPRKYEVCEANTGETILHKLRRAGLEKLLTDGNDADSSILSRLKETKCNRGRLYTDVKVKKFMNCY